MDESRIGKVQTWLKDQEFDALLIDDPIDLFYLTGLILSLGRLLILEEEAVLFVDGRYVDFAKKHAPCTVLLLSQLKQWLDRSIKMGFDATFTSVASYEALKEQFPKVVWKSLRSPMMKWRLVKEQREIDTLRRAAQVTRAGLSQITGLLEEGITEETLALEFEIFCRKQGASRLSFPPIIAFGENGAYPHYRSGNVPLKKNMAILCDLGAVVDHYAGDMTRMIFFGEVPEIIRKDYELVQRAQKKAIAEVRPGVAFGRLNQVARQEIEQAGCGHLFTHGLSHGIGLDVHEEPRLRDKGGDVDLILEPGMTFSVEPGIYREGIGGVRYEDIVVVTDTGYEIL